MRKKENITTNLSKQKPYDALQLNPLNHQKSNKNAITAVQIQEPNRFSCLEELEHYLEEYVEDEVSPRTTWSTTAGYGRPDSSSLSRFDDSLIELSGKKSYGLPHTDSFNGEIDFSTVLQRRLSKQPNVGMLIRSSVIDESESKNVRNHLLTNSLIISESQAPVTNAMSAYDASLEHLQQTFQKIAVMRKKQLQNLRTLLLTELNIDEFYNEDRTIAETESFVVKEEEYQHLLFGQAIESDEDEDDVRDPNFRKQSPSPISLNLKDGGIIDEDLTHFERYQLQQRLKLQSITTQLTQLCQPVPSHNDQHRTTESDFPSSSYSKERTSQPLVVQNDRRSSINAQDAVSLSPTSRAVGEDLIAKQGQMKVSRESLDSIPFTLSFNRSEGNGRGRYANNSLNERDKRDGLGSAELGIAEEEDDLREDLGVTQLEWKETTPNHNQRGKALDGRKDVNTLPDLSEEPSNLSLFELANMPVHQTETSFQSPQPKTPTFIPLFS